jgi:TolB-like protein
MRALKIILFFVFILSLSYATDNVKLRIAVMDFQAGSVSKEFAKNVTELIRGEMIDSNKFTVIERSQMDKIFQEQGFQQSICGDVSCAVEAGRILAARKMLIGTVMRIEKKFYISGRIVDVERGVGEFAVNQEIEDIDNLKNAVNRFTLQLIQRMQDGRRGGAVHCGSHCGAPKTGLKSTGDTVYDEKEKYNKHKIVDEVVALKGKKILIRELKIEHGLSPFERVGERVKDYLSEILLANGYLITPDDEIKRAEEKLQFSKDCFFMKYDNRCLKKILTITNSDYIVYGTISLEDEAYLFTLKMMDRSGEILRYKTFQFKDKNNIKAHSQNIADYIIMGNGLK